MRTNWLLLGTVAIVVGNFIAVSATNDVDQVNLASPKNGYVKRLLRASKVVENDEERVAPGTGLLDFTKTASLKTLDDVAADLAAIRGSSKFIKPLQAEVDSILIKVAARKWTPDSLEEKLNIAAKRAAMSDEQLMRDQDYLFAKLYRKFWDARRAQA
ncbi:RxLR effector protein [Phytophthora megakarya]|uniref:RxLR effector protein n=1 Tax=Phytophthora megakarya TaxID=4795 RepID=A0A225WR94_9STRA|nr:RxLR effector protein [Phytophthora megakarya]